MCLLIFFLVSLLPSTTQVYAQNGPSEWTASPFNAPALPLAVKSPYLNAWLPQGNDPSALNNLSPHFWTNDADTTGWYSSVVVDGRAYRIMGDADVAIVSNADQTGVEFTATRTSFIFNAGPMQINASFISPIEPTDLARQSLPFSYYTMSASSSDGSSHQLRMYSDISGKFITADASKNVTWNAVDEDQHVVLSMQLQAPEEDTEENDHAQDAVEYYAFKKIDGATTSWAIAEYFYNRNGTANMTSLGDRQITPPRQIDDKWPTLGIAVDWESITSTPEPAVWAVGVMRSPAIKYRTSSSTVQDYFPYFLTQWSDGVTAAKAFLDDFERATATSVALDGQLSAAGNAISPEYADLLALSARQVMGSLDITLSNATGEWNFSDTRVFMKNMGSAGSDVSNTGGTGTSVNTVDTLYAALPAFLYLNPEIAGYLLSPLLEYQDSSAYTQSYAARNIGSSYPNAIADGITASHDYKIEETANMLIMTLAYSQRSGNGTFLSRHYTLLRGWAEYLEGNTMTPLNERSADFTSSSRVSSSNQTNLVLKGIIGIACMSKIAELAEVAEDQQRFNETAASFISQWQTSALASDNSHINFIDGDTNTNGLIYNLYADQLLHLDLVPDFVYQVATVFYNNAATQATYGIPLNNGEPDRTSIHWMMFSAATVQDFATKQYMINQVREYAASNRNNTPFSVYYSPSTGIADSSLNAGKNSPAIGGIFALLALNTSIQSNINMPREGSTIPGVSSLSSSGGSNNSGAIAGGVVGGLAGAAVIGAGILFCLRRRRQRRLHEQEMRDARAEPLTIDVPTSPSSLGTRTNLPGFGDGVSPGPGFPSSWGGSLPTSSEPESLQQVLLAKQTLVAGELRSEVDNLRRDLDRMREEGRLSTLHSEAPPEYDGPSS